MNATVRQSSWIVTLSVAAAAVVYLTLVWLPSHRTLKEMRKQVETKRTFVTQATQLSAAMIGVQRDLDKAESVVRQWETAAPKKRDIPRLYGTIDALAKETRLGIGRFDPQPFVIHEKLQEIPITISCSGKFSQIHQFLQGIERLPATVWVESMRLEKTIAKTKDVQCELSLVVFSDNPQSSDYTRHSD